MGIDIQPVLAHANRAAPVAFMHHVAKYENDRFSNRIIDCHRAISSTLRSLYNRCARAKGIREANTLLRDLDGQLKAPGTSLSASAPDDEVKSWAKSRADHCSKAAQCSTGEFENILVKLKTYVERHGLSWPANIAKSDSPEVRRQKHLAAMHRACCQKWWRRQLRTHWGRRVEGVLRASGCVCSFRKAAYVSDWALQRWFSSQRRNRAVLEDLEVECESTGEIIALVEAVDASVANPLLRRNELMTRMRGWEEIAGAMGLKGLFFTLTTPSRFHAVEHASGRLNSCFNDLTPIESMEYLNKVWALIRSEWHRNKIRSFGLRVAEPHHDGTPHFHFLLFFSPHQAEKAKSIFGKHALADTPNEKGALEHRWKCDPIDPTKGTATGYIAKYISKNIDGTAIDLDYEGECDALDGAARVRAWASIWGIRQFQQIGNVSVTVWRELRRRKGPLDSMEPKEAEAIRSAADQGNWAEFVELMGGAFVARNAQALRALHIAKPQPNTYGEYLNKIVGVVMHLECKALGIIITRQKAWRVQNIGTAARRGQSRAAPPPALDLCQ